MSNCQIECQNLGWIEGQNVCQIECQNLCQIGCHNLGQMGGQNLRQIDCQKNVAIYVSDRMSGSKVRICHGGDLLK